MGENDPDFVLVFSTDNYDQKQVCAGIHSVIQNTPWIGCCTAGVITDRIETTGIAVLAIKSEEMKFGVGVGKDISKGAQKAGVEVAQMARDAVSEYEDYPESLVIILPDAISGNTSELIKGVYSVLGACTKYAGGGAGDNLRFIKTYQFINNQVYQDAVVAVLIKSKNPLGVGIRHGWKPVSAPMVVTSAKGNVVSELEWFPAFDMYVATAEAEKTKIDKSTFAEFAMTHPLGIPQIGGEFIIRDPLNVDEDGSITCVAEVPANSIVRIMKGTEELLISAVKQAARDALDAVQGRKIIGGIIFDCVSRSLMLKNNFYKEIEAIHSVVGKDVPIIGNLSFGEVGSISGGSPQFHNKTMVLSFLTE
jgi:hypothetical protein